MEMKKLRQSEKIFGKKWCQDTPCPAYAQKAGYQGKRVMSEELSMKYLYGNNNRNILDGWRNDNYTIYGYGGADDIYGNDYADYLYGDHGDDLVMGYDGGDLIKGGGGWDWLAGGAGGDQISGGTGDDALKGGAGKDNLKGGDGWDNLYGGRGTDVLIGGNGDDYLVGGNGADTFVFHHGDDVDLIADFTPGVDTIKVDLSYVDSFAELRQYIYRDGPDTIIDLRDGDTMILQYVHPNQLQAADFIFT